MRYISFTHTIFSYLWQVLHFCAHCRLAARDAELEGNSKPIFEVSVSNLILPTNSEVFIPVVLHLQSFVEWRVFWINRTDPTLCHLQSELSQRRSAFLFAFTLEALSWQQSLHSQLSRKESKGLCVSSTAVWQTMGPWEMSLTCEI